jgi:hypothetical protein
MAISAASDHSLIMWDLCEYQPLRIFTIPGSAEVTALQVNWDAVDRDLPSWRSTDATTNTKGAIAGAASSLGLEELNGKQTEKLVLQVDQQMGRSRAQDQMRMRRALVARMSERLRADQDHST